MKITYDPATGTSTVSAPGGEMIHAPAEYPTEPPAAAGQGPRPPVVAPSCVAWCDDESCHYGSDVEPDG